MRISIGDINTVAATIQQVEGWYPVLFRIEIITLETCARWPTWMHSHLNGIWKLLLLSHVHPMATTLF